MNVNQRWLSVAVAVALGMLGAVLLADPADLGISSVAARWLGIIATGLGVLATFLPRVQGPTVDPEALIDRVWGLPTIDRERVWRELADRAERERRLQPPDPLPPSPRYDRG